MNTKSNSRLVWIKWLLLLFVVLLSVLNYYAFIDVVDHYLQEFSDMLNNHGYHFDITEPISYLLKFLPSFGVIGYLITLNNKNFIGAMQNLYNATTLGQLLILAILLPVLLLMQNKFYGKITNYGTK